MRARPSEPSSDPEDCSIGPASLSETAQMRDDGRERMRKKALDNGATLHVTTSVEPHTPKLDDDLPEGAEAKVWVLPPPPRGKSFMMFDAECRHARLVALDLVPDWAVARLGGKPAWIRGKVVDREWRLIP